LFFIPNVFQEQRITEICLGLQTERADQSLPQLFFFCSWHDSNEASGRKQVRHIFFALWLA